MNAPGGAGPGVLRFALRALRRDWRAGELQVLGAAVAVAVASVTAVGFFTDRVQQAMTGQAGELLAADLVLAAPTALPAAWEREARRRALASARTVEFPSVLVHGERLELAELKAVSPDYPLRGALRAAPAPFAPDQAVASGPAPGTVWPDERLAGVLGLSPGDTVEVGAAKLRVARVLTYEPDRGGNLFSIAPRLLMSRGDLDATELIQTGSRVRHRLLLAGPAEAMARYRQWITPRLGPGQELQSLEDARPELRTALERARRFLGLAALVSVLLAGVGVAMAAWRHARRHQDPVAIMRCLGATQGFVLRAHLAQVALLGLAASAAGCLAGYLAQAALAALLGGLIPGALPPPGPAPVLTGLATGLITLLGFALPPLIRLRNVPPSRVLRRDAVPASAGAGLVYLGALAALGLLLFGLLDDPLLTGYALAGTAATMAALAAGAALMVKALAPLRGRVGVAWRYGLAAVARRSRESVLQVVAFGTGIMLLLLLTVVRAELLEGWRHRLPPQAPNYFLINIQPDEVQGLRGFLAANGVAEPRLYPMVRARLRAIAGQPVSAADYESSRAQRLVEREFNLSWARQPQSDNRIVAGQWWDADRHGQALFSVEQGLAETLGIALGDELRFGIAGREVRGRVSSLRSVQWDSFQVNFFVVAPPGVLEDYPATYITSFHLPAGERRMLAELVQRFPSVTVLDVDALMSKVREIMDQASRAVQFVFGFTLLAGLVVLAAAVQSTLDQRRYEGAVMRTLGGSRRQLLRGLLAEFLSLGALAGLLGALAAAAVGMALAAQVFELPYRPGPALWVAGVLGGTLGVGLAGVLGTVRVLSYPPVRSLREA